MKDSIKRLIEFSIGPLISSMIGFVMIPIITYLISPAEYGKVSMFTLMQSVITVAAYLGLDQAYIRFYNEYEDKKKLLFHAMLVPFSLAFLVITFLCCCSKLVSTILFGNSTYQLAIYLLALSIPFIIVERFILVSIRMEERAKLYSTFITITKIITFIITIFYILIIRKDFLSIVYATEIGQILNGILLLFVFAKKYPLQIEKIDQKLISQLVQFGIPLLFAGMINWALNSTDRIFLRIYSSYEQLGFYNMAFKITNLLLIIQTCFTTYWIPMAYRWKKEKVSQEHFQIVMDIMGCIMTILFLFILLAKDTFKIILSNNYMESLDIIPFLLIYPVMYCICETTSIGINFSNKSYYNLIASIMGMIINIILNALLIPSFNALGAAIATGISFLFFFWIKIIFSRKVWYHFQIKKLIYVSIMIIAISFLNIMIHNKEIYAINIIAICVTILIYKDLISYKNKILENVKK